jgi:arylsulfatase A-like enzyme/tetratricopeptide (TPR) repeat protein
VTIDTLRADRIGRGVAPALDRLADQGVQFTAARSVVPLTLPSHTSVMTGLLPPAHGVRENGTGRLSESHPAIARLLKGAGYRTAAFVGAFVLDHRFGLAQGFDSYDDQIPRDPDAADRLEAERPASAVVDRALAWLDVNQPPAPSPQPPFFVWIHLYDPHAPYNPPAEFARASPGYDGEVAYAGAQVARVLDWLRAKSLIDRTLVVVAGDHGEGLGDHGERTHGMLLYDSTLRVPLIVSAPGREAARRNEAVSLIDIAPTLLRAAGVAPPAAMTGRDLLETGRLEPDVYAETEYPRVAGWTPLQALTDGRWKTIRGGTAAEVYDLQHDPSEQHDLAKTQASVAGAMIARIDAVRSAGNKPSAKAAISSEAADRLRALGYVTGGARHEIAGGAPNPGTRVEAWSLFEDALNALTGKRPDALPMLRRLVQSNPNAPVFQMTYARALKDAGDLTSALAAYRAAARRWPTDAALLHDLSVAARDAAGNTAGMEARRLREEASRAEQAALVLAPDSATSHNGLGLIAVDEDRPRDAASEFERATTIDSGNASYWTNLGNARRSLRDTAGAEQAYRRALEADSRTADAANGLGVLLVEASRAAEAAPWFERAVAAAPDFVEARLNLGIALQQSGQTARAAEEYRRVLTAPGRHEREKQAAAKLLASLGIAR